MKHFPSNVARLSGMHAMSAKELAQATSLSPSTLAKWQMGERAPSFTAALGIGRFFGIAADRLANEPFEDLLDAVADRDRFENVEAALKILRGDLKTTPQGVVVVDLPSRPSNKREVVE